MMDKAIQERKQSLLDFTPRLNLQLLSRNALIQNGLTSGFGDSILSNCIVDKSGALLLENEGYSIAWKKQGSNFLDMMLEKIVNPNGNIIEDEQKQFENSEKPKSVHFEDEYDGGMEIGYRSDDDINQQQQQQQQEEEGKTTLNNEQSSNDLENSTIEQQVQEARKHKRKLWDVIEVLNVKPLALLDPYEVSEGTKRLEKEFKKSKKKRKKILFLFYLFKNKKHKQVNLIQFRKWKILNNKLHMKIKELQFKHKF